VRNLLVFMILSASVGREPREETLAAGANLFLEKPCLPEELEAAVRNLLDPKKQPARHAR
jgi:DNA-binding response OmpR family regulator